MCKDLILPRKPRIQSVRKSLSTYHNAHVHSHYSPLDGVGTIEEYAKLAVKSGMGYLIITDHGMVASWPELIEVCEKYGLRPGFGCEVYINNWHHLVPKFKELSIEEKQKVRKNNHMLLIAYNETGFSNLIKLVSKGWGEGFYGKPRVTMEQVAEYSEGLIATSGCLSSPINQELLKGDKKAAENLVREWSSIFPDRYWIEWMMLNLEPQDRVNQDLFRIADKTGLPLLLTTDCHYAAPEDYAVQSLQLAMRGKGTIYDIARLRIQAGKKLDDISTAYSIPMEELKAIEERIIEKEARLAAGEDVEKDDNEENVFQIETDFLWFATEDDMDQRWEKIYKNTVPFDYFEESKKQSLKLAQTCCYVNPDRSPKLPVVENADEIIEEISYKSLESMKKFYSEDEYQKRIERVEIELEMIKHKQMSSYLLVQEKICDIARNGCNSPIGPGRGSAGGCYVAYLIGIHEIDSVKHGTMFERFTSYNRGGRLMKCGLQ